MSESYIQLPVDGAGKKARAVSKVVGANTVFSEYQVEDFKLNFKGSYVVCLSTLGSLTAGHQFLSLFNPAVSGRIAKLKGIIIAVRLGSIANQVKVTRTISSGTGTGFVPVKKDYLGLSAVVQVVYDLTVYATLDKTVLGIAKPITATYALLNVNYKDAALEDDQIVLRGGEGIVVEQLSAGAATEVLYITIEWDEYTIT